MKVYIQSDTKYIPCNYNFFSAYQAYREMGLEIVCFNNLEELNTSAREDIVVGYVGTVRQRLLDFNIRTPEIDYPKELINYLGRRVWHSDLNTINSSPQLWPVFMKPVEDKKFTGIVVNSVKDLIGCGNCYDRDEVPVICSEIVNFVAEWRCFVRYGKVLSVRPYKGDWHISYNSKVIENAVKEYKSAPNGYAIDFGVTSDGKTLLIEVNDGYSLGSYGLFYIDYAKLLSARWAELTGTEDQCNF